MHVQGQNLTSVQGHVRSRDNPDKSCFIPVDAFRRDKHIGTDPTAPPLFYQKLREKRI